MVVDLPDDKLPTEPEKLRCAIVNDIKRGVTLLDAKGGYTNEEKNILLVVVNKKQQEVFEQTGEYFLQEKHLQQLQNTPNGHKRSQAHS